MQELYKFCRTIFCLVIFAVTPALLFAQPTRTLDAHAGVVIDDFIHGFYTSLPANYSTSGKSYPLLIFFHGQGELGDGSAASLPAVLRNGPPMQINEQFVLHTDANFPDPVVVNGNSYEFIVISPQVITQPDQNGPEQQMVDDVINYALTNYRVDASKISLTGLSMGGGFAIEYPGQSPAFGKRLSSLLGVAISSFNAADRVTAIKAANLPTWLTVNNGDAADVIAHTQGYVDQLNAAPALNPPAILNIFNAAGHGGWIQTYGAPGVPGVTNSAGQNVYQWMAQFTRVGDNVVVDGTPLPVTWGPYSATLTDSSSVRVNWSTLLEQNNKYFIVQRSSDGVQFSNLDTVPAANKPSSYGYTDGSPLVGSDMYRIVQVDFDGKFSYSGIMQVTLPSNGRTGLRISPNPAPGTVYIELENADLGRLELSLSDANGRILRKWAFDKQARQWLQSINPGNLPAGTYFITVKGAKTHEVRSFLRVRP